MAGSVMGGGGSKPTSTATNTGQPNWLSQQQPGLVAGGTRTIGPQIDNSAQARMADPNLQLSFSPAAATAAAAPAAAAPTAAAPAATAATGGNSLAAGGTTGGANPDYMTPGTEAYNNMNMALTTGPMAALSSLFQQGGMGDVMNAIMANMAGSSGSNMNMDQAAQMFAALGGPQGTANFQNLYNTAGTPGAAQQYLSGTAAGDLLKSNPYVDAIVNKGQEEAGTGVNQMFAAGGRYGSGANQGTLADSYQKIGNQYRGQEYENERARQMAAAGQISQEQLGRMGIQSGAAQGVGGLQQAGAAGLGQMGQNQMQNWLTSQMNAAGLQNQGIQNMLGGMGQLANVQGNKLFDANAQAGVGQETTNATQNMINDLINQWTQGDMQDWSRLGGLLSAATGSAGNYGTGTSNTTQSSKAGAGSIIGGLLSLVAMSDRRLKQDIEKLNGRSFAGLPLYQFRYKHDPDVLQVGVMSDDVRALYPEAVSVNAEGYDVVDYGLLMRHELRGGHGAA